MPNRILKESICRSDSIDSLSWFEEVLFYRLIVVCDDYGRFDGRPAVIRGACFPLKDLRLDQIDSALNNLSTAGMVRRYSVEDRPFLQLINWEQHQRIRAKKSKFPAHDNTCCQMTADDFLCGQSAESVDKCSRNPIQSESNPNLKDNARACEPGTVKRFEEFLASYPKRSNRHLVGIAYVDLVSHGLETEENLVICAKNYAEACQLKGIQEQFVKNAHNFLKDMTFEDYLPGRYKKPASPKKNSFTDFPQRNYDFGEMEKKLLGDREGHKPVGNNRNAELSPY